MIKRLLGLLAAIAVVVIVVLTTLRWGEYRSMILSDTQTATAVGTSSAAEQPAVPVSALPAPKTSEEASDPDHAVCDPTLPGAASADSPE